MENNTEILIYQSEDGLIKIETHLEDKTVWLTQEQIAALFGKGRNAVTEHIINVYEEGELEQSAKSMEATKKQNNKSQPK